MAVTIPKTKVFGDKRYELHKAFLNKSAATKIANDLRGEGYLARVFERAGELHFINRYHVYKRRK